MKCGVFGIGNVLLHDDAAGPSLIHFLQTRYRFEPDVALEDVGTPALDLCGHLADFDVVILADSVAADSAPGTVHTYGREAIMKHVPCVRISPHEPSLAETFLTLDLMGRPPRHVTLVGIVPRSVDGGCGLSDEVRNALPAAAAVIVAELASFGVQAREVDAPVEYWWERSPWSAGALTGAS
jgi:hydrogenase maturation protease